MVELGEVHPVDGVTSAGQPDEAGFTVFCSLRKATSPSLIFGQQGEDRGLDEPTVVTDLGMEYVSFPIGRDDIND